MRCLWDLMIFDAFVWDLTGCDGIFHGFMWMLHGIYMGINACLWDFTGSNMVLMDLCGVCMGLWIYQCYHDLYSCKGICTRYVP